MAEPLAVVSVQQAHVIFNKILTKQAVTAEEEALLENYCEIRQRLRREARARKRAFGDNADFRAMMMQTPGPRKHGPARHVNGGQSQGDWGDGAASSLDALDPDRNSARRSG